MSDLHAPAANGSPVYCALDVPSVAQAAQLAQGLKGYLGGLKLGLEYFCANGPQGVAPIAEIGLPVFLDLKLHDIPNTVAGAVRSLGGLGVSLMTLHAQGGPAMLEAAAEAAQGFGAQRPKLLGVTVLTSLGGGDLAAIGADPEVERQVERLAKLVKNSGLDGIVCAPTEIIAMRRALGPDMLIVTPGIRPLGAAAGDQKRMMTPRQARDAGADILVIGRPITQAGDPARAARAIAAELG